MIIFKEISVTPKNIDIGVRVRQDLGELDPIAMSIHKNGLLHPPVYIPLPDGKYRLIAGERRTRICFEKLGWKKMPVRIPVEKDGEKITKENATLLITEDDILEMELEENCKRKDWTFEERVRAVEQFHEVMVRRYGKGGQGKKSGWGMRDTARHLGISLGTVSQDIKLAKAIKANPELALVKNKDIALTKLKRTEEKAQHEKIVKVAEKTGFKPDYLFHGNNLEWLSKLETKSVDTLFTDPPYAVNYDESQLADIRWDGVYDVKDIPHEIFQHLSLVLKETFRVLKKEAHAFVWFHMSHYDTVKSVIEDAGFKTNPIPLFWVKDKHGGGTSPYTWSNALEPCFHAWKGRPKVSKVGVKNYYQIGGVTGGGRIHPTEKPLRLIMPILEMSTPPGGTVMDPYAGSASTLRAAIASGMKGIGAEMKEEHYKAAVAMLLKQTFLGAGDGRKSPVKSGEPEGVFT